MAEFTPVEKIQPCLLDRLTDEEPGKKQESRNNRVISMSRYREAVLRDLRWLFNSHRHGSDGELKDFPEVERSVLNFGTRDLCGILSSGLDVAELENHILEVIRQFEPRIIRQTLVVRALENANPSNPATLAFEIQGELWAYPMSEQLFIKTQIDLETGQYSF